MATVTQLLDRGCRITGLRTTGTERELALQALQDAYTRAVLDSECSLSTVAYTFVASSDNYDLSTILGEQPLRLYHVSLTTSAGNTPMQQVSFQELLDIRENNNSPGPSYVYATVGFNDIAFYPNPAVGESIRVWYVDDVPTLHETDNVAPEETTPSMIPAAFHWSVLLPGMVLEMLDKDQRAAEADMWMRRYERGIARLVEHIGQFGGEANRAYLKKGVARYRYNDQLGRRW